MQDINIYDAIALIRNSEIPFTLVFTSVNLSKNEGGERVILENQLPGPKKHNQNERLMLGLQGTDGLVRHVYIHSIMEVHFNSGQSYKLIME